MPPRPLARLRSLCLALPDAREVEAWGTSTFRVKTMFAMYSSPDSHHGEGREGVWIKATMTNQALMVQAAPDRFFVPPYMGPSGWVGVYIDSPRTDWDELAELLRDAWRMSAPKRLVAKHESDSGEWTPVPRQKTASKRTAKRASKSTSTKKSTTKKSTTKTTAKQSAKRSTKSAPKTARKTVPKTARKRAR